MPRRSRLLILPVLMLAASCSGEAASPAESTLPVGALPGTAPAGPGRPEVTVATFNLLHGIFCPEGSDGCRAAARLRVLASHLEAAGCPDLVGLQEVGPRQAELIPGWLPGVCGGRYRAVWAGEAGLDREMVLTSRRVLEAGLLDLAAYPWEAVWVRVEASGGTVDFLTAHFASSSNNPECRPLICPAVCPDGIAANECHGIEVAAFFAAAPAADLAVVAGDLNTTPEEGGSLAALTVSGFLDAWVVAGRPPCDPRLGDGCTGGGEGATPLGGLDTVAGPPRHERIDYVLVRPAGRCRLNVEAEPFAATPLREPIEGMYWASDHAGVLARLGCG